MKDTSLRKHFPFFSQPQNSSLIYFDSAATTHKPQCVLDAIQDFYLTKNVNVHRSSFTLANNTTNLFEQARRNISTFLGAKNAEQIIFTKGATESINLVARALGDTHIEPGSRILVSASEHHANLVPWQQLAKKKNLKLDIIPINKKGLWEIDRGLEMIRSQTCVVALGMVSNALGTIQPIQSFIKKAKDMGALTLVDAAQAVSHISIDVQALDCDFLAFSSHKMYGPTGVGVLYGKQKALETLPVFLSGGEMVKQVSFQDATYQHAPYKFEAGTPNIEGIFALDAAVKFVVEHRDQLIVHEAQLIKYLVEQMSQFENLVTFGDPLNGIATLSFHVEGQDSQDIAILLNEQNIALRVGHHCAMPLMNELGVSGTIRVSMACYNTLDEIDVFILALKNALQKLKHDLPLPKNLSTSHAPAQTERGHSHPIAQGIQNARGWDQVYRQIMLAGKGLERLAQNDKTAQNEVYGCESQVWLVADRHPDNTLSFQADASGKIVRGLLAIILEPIQHQPASKVVEFDFDQYLARLGVDKHLSESRGNGLREVVKRIQSISA